MSAAAQQLNEKIYRRVLGQVFPRLIQNDEDLEAMTERLLRLDDLIEEGRASAEQAALAELLTILIEKYEDEHYPVISAPPQSIEA